MKVYPLFCNFLVSLLILLISCNVNDREDFSSKKEQEQINQYLIKNPNLTLYPEGFYYQNLVSYTESRSVDSTDTINIHQLTKALSNTKQNISKGNINALILGEESPKVIKGIELGVQIMKLGEKGLFLFPSKLTYDNYDLTGFPLYTPLLIEIEILKIGQEDTSSLQF